MLGTEVAEALEKIADILEIRGDQFRPRAYRRAARSVEASSADLVQLMESKNLDSIPGVGASIAAKIEEFIQTGRMSYLEQLRSQIPGDMAKLLRIPNVGPKTAKLLYESLGITTVEQLDQAVRDHRLKAVKGMGQKTEENILRGIALIRRGRERMLLGRALAIAEEIEALLSAEPSLQRISLAGSIRRMKETVGDVDVLVTTAFPAKVTTRFVSMPMVREILAKGETKSSVLLNNGLQVDLRIIPDDCFGSALQYFTGSKEHNIKLREIAQRRQMKLSEYGLFDSDGRRIAGQTEEAIYHALDMEYIEPELRENAGEIDAALAKTLPKIISPQDVKGDFHVHSSWSDGRSDITSIALKARSLGYDYVAITDHSKTLKIAHGLDESDVVKQREEIAEVNDQLKGRPRVLAGLEVDIKSNGSLDTSGDVLESLDLVVASIHTGFRSGKRAMTQRMIQAMSTGLVSVLAHPTGRILGRREAYSLDEDAIFDAAARNNVWLEINAFPDRLDLNDRLARRAAEMGLKLAIGTDSHDAKQMDYMRYGVAVARRAWLERKDVANCAKGVQILKQLGAKRAADT